MLDAVFEHLSKLYSEYREKADEATFAEVAEESAKSHSANSERYRGLVSEKTFEQYDIEQKSKPADQLDQEELCDEARLAFLRCRVGNSIFNMCAPEMTKFNRCLEIAKVAVVVSGEVGADAIAALPQVML
jgi:hypothetical protein